MAFKIVSFYTLSYKEIAEKYLIPSLKKLNIEPYIACIPDLMGWKKSTDYKAQFCLDCLNGFKEDIVWIDCDATVNSYPILFDELCNSNVDISYHMLDWECVDEKTEILTNKGWRKWDELKTNELAVSLNLKTLQLEENIIDKKFVYEYNGKMCYLKNRRIDRLVTPNHKELFQTKKFKTNKPNKVKFAVPYNLKSGNYLFNLSPNGYKGKYNYFYSIEQLKLIAWIITEGGNDKGAITITQSLKNYQYVQEIKKILDKLQLKYSFLNHSEGVIRFRISTLDSKKYIKFIKTRKFPSWVLTLSQPRLEQILYTLVKGDGHIIKNYFKSFYFSNKNYNLIEQVQIIAIKCGYSTHLWVHNKEGVYAVNCTLSRTAYLPFDYITKNNKSYKGNPYKSIDYIGKVWCIKTKNNTIVCRRNGISFITGNSHYGRPKDVGRFEFLSGTLYFKNNEKVKQLANKWIEYTKIYSPEQKALEEAIKQTKELITAELPREYCYINTKPDGTVPAKTLDKPIVEHFQASRGIKK